MISKKITALALASVMVLGSVVSAGAAETKSTLLYGDADGDGVIAIADATAIQRHSSEIDTLDKKYEKLADVTGDGKVTVDDATCVQRYIAEISGAGKTGTPYVPEGADAEAEKMLTLINNERIENGLSPLATSEGMTKVAQTRLNELTVKYDSTRPNGKKWYTAFDDCGVKIKTAAYEMFARYYKDSEALFAVWDSNPQKSKSYMSKDFKNIGIAVTTVEYEGDDYYYWELVLNG